MPVLCTCETCGTTFSRKPSMVGKYCSNPCRGRAFGGEQSCHWKGGLTTYTCENPACGKTFDRAPSRTFERTYCSRDCKHAHLRGPNSPNWKGGRHLDSQGYVLVVVPGHHRTLANGYVHEHIIVAEQMIGRPLLPEEVVHHIERGIAGRSNNDPSNLEILSSNSEHLKLHHREGFSRNKSAK